MLSGTLEAIFLPPVIFRDQAHFFMLKIYLHSVAETDCELETRLLCIRTVLSQLPAVSATELQVLSWSQVGMGLNSNRGFVLDIFHPF